MNQGRQTHGPGKTPQNAGKTAHHDEDNETGQKKDQEGVESPCLF